ncbi:MAG: DUF29 domain-containing protein, partial [Aquificota bacterium]
LKEGLYDLVDWENLLEEIEDMAQKHLDSCISHLAVILEHMYEWDHFRQWTKAGKEKGGLSWIRSIDRARTEISKLFRRYPSLRNKLPDYLELAWQDAVDELKLWLKDISKESLISQLPSRCPYTYEEAMTRDLRREL